MSEEIKNLGGRPSKLTDGNIVFKKVAIDSLHFDPANARKHGKKNKDVVRSSLKEFGQVEALVVEKGSGKVIGGNCRLEELRVLGQKEVWVAEVDVHGIDAVRLGLVLNRSAELAEWDVDVLSNLLIDLPNIENIGFDDDILKDLDKKEDEIGVDQTDNLKENFQILIELNSEQSQSELLQELHERGYNSIS